MCVPNPPGRHARISRQTDKARINEHRTWPLYFHLNTQHVKGCLDADLGISPAPGIYPILVPFASLKK